VIMHRAQESNDVGGMGVVIQKIVIHPEAIRPRCAAQGRHRGDAVVPIPGVLHWSVAALRPHPTPQRLQHKATFVDENQASLAVGALFLVAASARSASGRFRIRDVRGPVAPASADSSQAGAAACPHNRDDSPRRTAAESDPAPRAQTILPPRNPSTRTPDGALPSTFAVGLPTTSPGAPDEAWPPVPALRHVARLASTGWPMTDWHLPPQPLSLTIPLAQKAGLPHVGELPAPREFRSVSCTIIRSSPL